MLLVLNTYVQPLVSWFAGISNKGFTYLQYMPLIYRREDSRQNYLHSHRLHHRGSGGPGTYCCWDTLSLLYHRVYQLENEITQTLV